MAKQVDQRIVQMEFDNKKFEQGVRTTLDSIGRLDSTLNKLNSISLKGFEKLGEVASSVNFDVLTNAAEAVSSRMSAMGVVGATVLSNLTNSAINAAKSLSSITIGQIMTGGKNRALNIEAAKFQLEGLHVAWEDIEEDINFAVKGTAYGLDEAAKAASQLVASNVKVGDEMAHSLRAISGVAAMTNRSYEDTASIFTTVAGNGRLMTDQLNQLSSRGLNAAAILAKGLGKTEAEIRDMTSKGKIDFKTFAKVMDDEFGEHAKDANKTFTGALSNMKAALSRIGAEFYQPGLEYARDIFNSITEAVNQFKSALADNGVFKNASAIMGTISEHISGFFTALGDKGKMNSAVGRGLKIISGGLGTISSVLNRGLDLKVLEMLGTVVSNVSKIIRAAFAGIKKAFPVDILAEITYIVNVLSDKITEFDKQATIYMRIRDTIAGLASVLKIVWKITDSIWRIIGKPVFDKVVNGIKEVLKWTGDLGNQITDFANNFHPFTKLFNDIQYFKRILIPKLNDSVDAIEKNFIDKFGKSLPAVIEDVKNKIHDLFHGNYDKDKKSFDWVGLVTVLIDGLTKAIIILTDVVATFYNVFGKGKSVFDYISEGWDKVIDRFNSFIGFIQGKDFTGEFTKDLSPGLQKFLTDARDIFGNFKQIVKDAFEYVKPLINNAVDVLKNLTFKDILKTGGILLGVLGANGIIGKVKELFELFKHNTLVDELSKITGMFGSVGEFFSSMTAGLFGKKEDEPKQEKYIRYIKELAISLGILAGSMFVLSSIDEDKLGKSLATVSALIVEFIASLYVINKYITSTGSNIDILIEQMLGFSIAMLILASSLKKISKIDPERLGGAFGVLSGMLWELVLAMYAFKKIFNESETEFPKIGATLLATAVAIRILASAVAVIGKLGASGTAAGLIGVLGLLAEVTAFFYGMKKITSMEGGSSLASIAASLILLAVGINMLVIPLAALAIIASAGQLGSALVGLGILLGELGLFTGIMNDVGAKSFAGLAASLVIMAIAINMLILPLAAMAIMGERLTPALVGLGILLSELAIFTGIMNDVGASQFAGLAASLVILAVALNMLILPLIVMAKLGETLPSALLGLAVLLGELAIFTGIMNDVGAAQFAGVAASLIIFAIALNLLMIPLAGLSALASSGTLWESVLALAALLAVIAGFTAVLAILSTFSVELLLLGVAVALVGAGVLAVCAGFTALAAGVYLLVAAFSLFIQTAMSAGSELVNLAITAAFAIVAFMVTLGNAGPQLIGALTNIIVALCDAILGASTKIAETIFTLIIKLLDVLTDKVPMIILDLLELVFAVLDGLLKGLTDKVPVLARDLYNFCMTLLDETVKLIKQTPLDLFDIFFGGGFDKTKNEGKKLGDWFKGIFSKNKDSEEVKEAGEQTAEAVVDSTAEAIDSTESQNKVNDSLDSLVAGAGQYISGSNVLNESMEGLSIGGFETMADYMQMKGGESDLYNNTGGVIPKSLASGVDQDSKLFEDSMTRLGNKGAKAFHDSDLKFGSPSKKMIEFGKFIDEGFAIGINSNSNAERAANSKALGLTHIFESIGDQVSNMKMPTDGLLSAFFDSSNAPTITPVLDLSNVNSGFAALDGLFQNSRTVQLAGEASYFNEVGRSLNLEIQNENRNGTNNTINSLGSKIDRLGEAIMNRQIVLDSGQLVGGLVNPMDRSLGARAIRAQRVGAR